MADKPKFKVGSKVKLNSGGPDMSVRTVNVFPSGVFYDCQWFAGKKLEDGRFAQDSLDAVPEGDE
ncbi:DUF2158 domain-containing protein [Stenotrophomonas indicatrix]|uniref:DUF2158 domain-containing protein n=1 Tax=Stenotrophomonas indicatrix TaxID=2045451 RepID=UPI00320889A1